MSSAKVIIISTAGSLIVLAAIGIVAYLAGRKSKEAETVGLPEATDWGGSLTADESAQIEDFAKRLFNDMDGLNLSHDGTVYLDYLAATDRVFVGTANYFAEKYGNGENLAEWIAGETFAAAKLLTAQKILERLETYGITTK